jgi:predicted nucleic acid-binding protein
MIKVVMDTSSLVSLEMVGLLRRALKITEITIPAVVAEELKEISKFSDPKGKAAENISKLIDERKISVVKIRARKKVDGLLSSDVDEGEASCFVCCVENGIENLVMDDVDAAYELEGRALASEIKLKISAAVIIELMRKKVISKKRSASAIKKMVKLRGWEGGVLEVLAKKYLGYIK